jgi:DNA-binding transcriptional MerR regulator
MPSPQDIPDKLYFKIGEVAEIIGVPSYVLRFWETEFPYIRPKRTGSGQRLYRKNDVELILTIKHLLHEKRFTIEGAKQHLRAKAQPKAAGNATGDKQILKDIKVELESIRDLLR